MREMTSFKDYFRFVRDGEDMSLTTAWINRCGWESLPRKVVQPVRLPVPLLEITADHLLCALVHGALNPEATHIRLTGRRGPHSSYDMLVDRLFAAFAKIPFDPYAVTNWYDEHSDFYTEISLFESEDILALDDEGVLIELELVVDP